MTTQEPQPPPGVVNDQVAETPVTTCSKCGRQLEREEYCVRCGARRMVVTGLLLLVGAPFLGLGFCANLVYGIYEGQGASAAVGLLCVAAPIVGLGFIVFGVVKSAD